MYRFTLWTVALATTFLAVNPAVFAVTANVNVARSGTASQSTNGAGTTAARGNDGGTGTSFGLDASTTHTNGAAFSSWQIDLGTTTEITQVDLFSRGDCCNPLRLGDFRVDVLDAPGGTVVHSQHFAGSVAQNTVQTFAVPDVMGQVVRVHLVGENGGANDGLNNAGNGVLSLREVVVKANTDIDNGINLAGAFGTASQSSTLNNGFRPAAQRAIDGNTDGNFNNGSVTHTNNVANSFLEVDLQSNFHIDNIRLFNRNAGQNRLSNYNIDIFDENHVLVSSIDNPGGPGTGFHAVDPGTQGRFVRVQLDGVNNDGNGILSLAEIQVFGGALENIARNPNAVATQSSTRGGVNPNTASGGNVAEVAIDGITNPSFFGDNSVTHTNTENNPFWNLDFGGIFRIDELVLFNRAGNSDRLSGAEVRLLYGLDEVFMTTLGTSTGIPRFSLDAGNIDATSLRITLPGNNRVLSLAEVQVFGSAIPEPTTALLGLIGLAGLATRRRRAA